MTTPRRGARSLWTFGTGVTFTVLTTGLSFVITPFVLRWLGAERFGIQRALMDKPVSPPGVKFRLAWTETQ